MIDENALVTLEQQTVHFYGDELVAIRANDGNIYVSVRHLCDALGLDRTAQVRRIKRQTLLQKGYKGGAMMAPPSESGVGGGSQQVGLLRVDLIPLWLSGLDTNRVKEEIREKLERYQEEVARVLWEAFREGRLTGEPTFEALLQAESPAVQAYRAALAIVEIARQQVILEGRLGEHERRLEAIESVLGNTNRFITNEQAMHLSQGVKTVALVMGKKTGRNEFQGVYGELYRRFKVPSYRELPARKFEEAMGFLREWYQSMVDEDVPF